VRSSTDRGFHCFDAGIPSNCQAAAAVTTDWGKKPNYERT